ncbi:MAG: RagB/SusD family nutrient uptake outer membrane protein [Muribaculaceae bacterium]|nr:RagB/SusD family nutrient uptake outer membrane protein [Muribaculaceae bacterium]
MKKIYIKALAALMLSVGTTSCGDSFLDTEISNGIDLEGGLSNVQNIGYALNGTYYRLFHYYFAGDYATSVGDLASDISYWNGSTGHLSDFYQFTPTPTTSYLGYIWNYGYKVADNSSRIIKAGKELTDLTEEEQSDLDEFMAEAYALRAYAHFVLVNIFGHQYMVNGTSFADQPGIVVIDEPIPAGAQVARSTVGDAYKQIESDLKNSLDYFERAGWENDGIFYFTPAAVQGLLSRVYLYEEKYADSADAAQKALDLKGISELAYTDASYKALYNGGASNNESFFALNINTTDNWSANSCGTLWSTYSYSPSPYLQSIMADDDVRRAVWGWASNSTPATPFFTSGKFGAFGLGGNSAYGTNYLINAPEMFLNQAESYLKLNKLEEAKDALLVVAKRNPSIETVADLPASSDALFAFIQEERARELFQEGLRLYDLRRWDVKAHLNATGAPEVKWFITDFKVSDCVYPIPADEINAGYGVTQTPGWASTFPSI